MCEWGGRQAGVRSTVGPPCPGCTAGKGALQGSSLRVWLQGISANARAKKCAHGLERRNEIILLEREPFNPYDGNAIEVKNVRGEKVGVSWSPSLEQRA